MDSITKLAVKEVVEKYSPHTVVVYGSRARGDSTIESDIDIACFCDSINTFEDIRQFNGVCLDASVYPTEAMRDTNRFLKFDKALCAVDELGFGKKLLQRVRVRVQDGPVPLDQRDKLSIVELRLKSLKRASKGDIEGNYKRSWLQFSLLETYFLLRGMWYLGPKQSLIWLMKNDQAAYALFDDVYQSPQNYDALKKLTYYTVNI